MTSAAKHRYLIIMAVLCLLALVAVACGGEKRIGSKDLLDFDEQQDAKRLGEGSPTPSPKAEQSPNSTAPPKPAQTTAAPPPAEVKYFEVGMVAASPYFEPGNQLVMSQGLTLRVTNKDNTAERPTRSFTAEDGTFDSGPLKPGETWTYKFKSSGTFRVVDKNAPFIYASLEVR